MTRFFFVGLFAASVAAACGGDSVSIVDKSPEEQSIEIADHICEYSETCGEVDIECSSTGDGLDCTGTIDEVDYQTCYDDVQPDVQQDFERCDLTTAEERKVQDCMNAILDQPCITQDELDEYVAELEAGNEPDDLRSTPPVCQEVADVFENCDGA